jgi:hypothetical protein
VDELVAGIIIERSADFAIDGIQEEAKDLRDTIYARWSRDDRLPDRAMQ